MDSIFVSIASYRDPELIPTIKDLLDKAKHPDRVFIGVAWQHGEGEPDPSEVSEQVSMVDILAEESLGACWARWMIQDQLFEDEDYYFQLDSHHRFIKNWDTELISMLHACKSPKPVLTTYVPAYNPETYEDNAIYKLRQTGMVADYFQKQYPLLMFRPAALPSHVKTPVKIRYFSAHCVFARGQFVRDVPYDPNLYFHGEEVTLALRAYTHGYDLYCPHKTVCTHEYTRKGRTKHWDEHRKTDNNRQSWFQIDKQSKERCTKLLLDNEDKVKHEFGIYGLGNARTRHDYERYAGVHFATQQIHPVVKKQSYVESMPDYDNWTSSATKYAFDISIDANEVNQADDLDFCFVGVEDNRGNLLFRHDLRGEELQRYCRNSQLYHIVFEDYREPHVCIIWPYSKSKQWLNKVTKSCPKS